MKIVVSLAEIEPGQAALVIDRLGNPHVLSDTCSEVVLDSEPGCRVDLIIPAPLAGDEETTLDTNPHGGFGAIEAPTPALVPELPTLSPLDFSSPTADNPVT